MVPKLILTDLDGTLLTYDKRLTPRSRAALERAAAGGAQVVVATGRLLTGVPQPLLELPFLRYFVLMNGAKVYDRQEDKVLYRSEIPLELAWPIFDLGEELGASVDCFQGDRALMEGKYYDRMEYYIPDPGSRALARLTRTRVEDLRREVAAGGETVQKIQYYFPDLELRPMAVERLKRDFPQVVTAISMPGNLEINDSRATKGHALEALCRHLGLDLVETAAFGDGTNDLTMIQKAGMGVAMANAAPETLAAADRVAPSNQEEGVAQVLEEWFLNIP